MKGLLLVAALLGMVGVGLFVRNKFFGGGEASDFYPVKGGASRMYPGRLPSSIGLTADEAPAIPVAATPGALPPDQLPWAHFARARMARMGFR